MSSRFSVADMSKNDLEQLRQTDQLEWQAAAGIEEMARDLGVTLDDPPNVLIGYLLASQVDES